jgi:hypothetical protein
MVDRVLQTSGTNVRVVAQGRAAGGERTGFTSDLKMRHWTAQIELYVLAHRASRAVISGLFAGSGKNLPTRHYIFRGGDATAPEAWVCCETTEACSAPSRQRCRERTHRSRHPARAVVWTLMWTQGSRRRCRLRAESYW